MDTRMIPWVRKVAGPTVATSAIKKVSRSASPEKPVKGSPPRSESYNPENLVGDIHWQCDTCRLRGTIVPDEEASIATLVSSVKSDHANRSPECPGGDSAIQIVPSRALRQWLSPGSS